MFNKNNNINLVKYEKAIINNDCFSAVGLLC